MGKSMQCDEFSILDATKMTFSDNSFDAVVLYNTFFHVEKQWNEIEDDLSGLFARCYSDERIVFNRLKGLCAE